MSDTTLILPDTTDLADRVLKTTATAVERYRERRRSRQSLKELRKLDDSTLKDLGVHRSELPSIALGVNGLIDAATRRGV